jgi:hypothetical protein
MNRHVAVVATVASCASSLVGATFDLGLLANCQTCTSDTQPACMDLLETANFDSPKFDILFSSFVTCDELEFAFECVILQNNVYPLGYLDYYFDTTGTTTTDCETYASYFNTFQCAVQCVEAGSSAQEGAEEYFCEQVGA